MREAGLLHNFVRGVTGPDLTVNWKLLSGMQAEPYFVIAGTLTKEVAFGFLKLLLDQPGPISHAPVGGFS